MQRVGIFFFVFVLFVWLKCCESGVNVVSLNCMPCNSGENLVSLVAVCVEMVLELLRRAVGVHVSSQWREWSRKD